MLSVWQISVMSFPVAVPLAVPIQAFFESTYVTQMISVKSVLFVCVIVWLSLAVTGVFYLARFEATAAEEVVFYPSVFPVDSQLTPGNDVPTLIFFAHPKCPCTRAGLRELARLMAEIDGKVSAYAVFLQPKGVESEWTVTGSFNAAKAIPNLQVVIDKDERETTLFNARTSSITLLYDRDKNLRFNGGLTLARGHEGSSPGRNAIFDIVTSDISSSGASPVFGCPLQKKDCQGEVMQGGDQPVVKVN